MPATTLGFPYPAAIGVAPDGPGAFQALAQALDTFLTPSWTAFTGYASGLSANSFGFPPAWWKRGDGRVFLRGNVQKNSGTFAGGGGSVIFASIASAIRPSSTIEHPCATNYASSVDVNTRIEITGDGQLQIYCGASAVSWVSLDGISYWVS